VAAYVLVAPPPERTPRGSRQLRELYLERIGADGSPTHTPHAIAARRFVSAHVARRWASQFGELLGDYVVARR